MPRDAVDDLFQRLAVEEAGQILDEQPRHETVALRMRATDVRQHDGAKAPSPTHNKSGRPRRPITMVVNKLLFALVPGSRFLYRGVATILSKPARICDRALSCSGL